MSSIVSKLSYSMQGLLDGEIQNACTHEIQLPHRAATRRGRCTLHKNRTSAIPTTLHNSHVTPFSSSVLLCDRVL